MIVAFVIGHAWARRAMWIDAIGSLSYLLFGSLLGVVQIAILLLPATARQRA